MPLLTKDKGHALPEFVAMGAVFLPLVLMVPMMGKVADIDNTSIQASRYAAWERTVASEADKTNPVLQMEVRRRFFQKADVFIKTDEAPQTGNANQNVLWRGYANDRFMTDVTQDVQVTTTNGDTPGSMAGTVTGILSGLADAMSALSSGAEWDIDNSGLYRADVSVNVGANTLGFGGRQDCTGQDNNQVFACLRRHNVILADTWSARDPAQVTARVRSFVPMGMFEPVADVMDAVSFIPLLQEFDTFEPGIVLPDVIPGDRLGTYRN